MEKITKTEAEWRAQLTPEEYHITRKHGTERAFTGPYHDAKDKGTYTCKCCGLPLFASDTKFDFGDRMAELLRPDRKAKRGGEIRQHALHAPHRSPLRPLRRPPRPRLPRRPETHGPALLHERPRAEAGKVTRERILPALSSS